MLSQLPPVVKQVIRMQGANISSLYAYSIQLLWDNELCGFLGIANDYNEEPFMPEIRDITMDNYWRKVHTIV